MNKKISFFSLSILMISAIDNMKNMPGTALFGSSLLFFFFLSAVFFLIPVSLMSAELAAAFPEKGGVFHWVDRAFGSSFAFTAVWLQWINTVVWYPTMLSFIAGAIAYIIAPELIESKTFLISCILTVFWGLTFINLMGIRASTKITNVCTIVGTIFPMLLLIILGSIWIFKRRAIQIDVHPNALLPSLAKSENWSSLVVIMASFLGMELSGVHVNDVREPKKNFPKAVLLATIFVFLSMGLSSLSIAIVLPKEKISLVAGVMQVFHNFFDEFGLKMMTPILALTIALGSMGTMVNWLISPAKGLFQAAEYGFLPPFFKEKNEHGVASNILLAQAVLVSGLCLLFLLLPSVNGIFWFLTALSTELYMVMYVLMFLAGLKLHYTYCGRPSSFKIPGKSFGIWVTALLGLCGCFCTIIVSFLPPSDIEVGNTIMYLCLILFGNILALSPLLFFLAGKKRQEQKALKEGIDSC